MRISKSLAIRRLSLCLFIGAELLIYLLFMARDMSGNADTTKLKYASVLLCFVFSLLWEKSNLKDNAIVSAAFVFTLIADVFLLLKNDKYEAGIISFLAVHSLYLIRLALIARNFKSCDNSTEKVNIKAFRFINIVRVGVMILLPLVIYLFLNDYFTATNILAGECYCMLISNAALCFCFLKNKKMRFFGIALILFALCDFCVGAFNIFSHGFIYDFSSVMMWGFYLPSQVLICLSSVAFYKKTTINNNVKNIG